MVDTQQLSNAQNLKSELPRETSPSIPSNHPKTYLMRAYSSCFQIQLAFLLVYDIELERQPNFYRDSYLIENMIHPSYANQEDMYCLLHLTKK